MEKKSKLTGLTDPAMKVIQALKVIAEVADEALAAAVRGFAEKLSEPESPSKVHDGGPHDVAKEAKPAPVTADETVVQTAESAWVRFEVIAKTDFGQTVSVVGGAPSLGSWDPQRALPLDPVEYPKWSARAQVETHRPVEYKYVRKNADGSFTWEALSGNRVVGSDAVGGDEITWEVDEPEATSP